MAAWSRAPKLAGPELVGEPTFGTFEGSLASTALVSQEHSWLARVRKEKRWQWFGVVAPDVAIGGALLNTGYAGQVFLWVFDRVSGELLCDHTATLPRGSVRVAMTPGQGTVASFRKGAFAVERRDGVVEVRCDAFGVDAVLEMYEEDVSEMTAICPVPGGTTNVTQKQAGLRVQGVVRLGSRVWHVGTRARGSLDYTHGMMARRTSWRWAIGGGEDVGGKPVSFNLVAGFNDGLENVMWSGGEIICLPRVRFESGASSWKVTSLDGRVDLSLAVEGERSAVFKAGLIESIYTQPIGRWSGRIGDVEFGEVHGVAEDHRAVW